MLFIAEIGMNHNGNLDLCNELVRQAKWAGADIAKFQLGWRANPDEINHITPNDLKKIEEICKYNNIEFMASIITEEGFDLSNHVNFNRYKIASRTVIDKPDLVHSILKIGKPTFLSLGMWEKDELPFKEYNNVTYMWPNMTISPLVMASYLAIQLVSTVSLLSPSISGRVRIL